jgi:hypothetical protein
VAGGLGLMRPLKRLPLRAIGRHLLLVLYWIPVVQEEVLSVWQQHRPVYQVRQGRGRGGLWRHSTGLLADLMGRLAVKVEGVTDAMAAGELSIEPPLLSPLLRCGFKDRLTLLLAAAAAAIWFWGVP